MLCMCVNRNNYLVVWVFSFSQRVANSAIYENELLNCQIKNYYYMYNKIIYKVTKKHTTGIYI